MAKQVRLTVAKAIAKANLRRAEAGEKPITINAIVTGIGVAATTITHLAWTDGKGGNSTVIGSSIKDRDCAGLRHWGFAGGDW